MSALPSLPTTFLSKEQSKMQRFGSRSYFCLFVKLANMAANGSGLKKPCLFAASMLILVLSRREQIDGNGLSLEAWLALHFKFTLVCVDA